MLFLKLEIQRNVDQPIKKQFSSIDWVIVSQAI